MLRLRLHVARTAHGGGRALLADHADAVESGAAPQERSFGCAGVVCALESVPRGTTPRVAPDPVAQSGRSATARARAATGVLEARSAPAGEPRAGVADRTRTRDVARRVGRDTEVESTGQSVQCVRAATTRTGGPTHPVCAHQPIDGVSRRADRAHQSR